MKDGRICDLSPLELKIWDSNSRSVNEKSPHPGERSPSCSSVLNDSVKDADHSAAYIGYGSKKKSSGRHLPAWGRHWVGDSEGCHFFRI